MAHDSISIDGSLRNKLKLPRLHWLSWLTLLASTIVVALLMVPGLGVAPTLLTPQPFMWGRVSGTGPMPNPDLAVSPLLVEEYEHGWPFTFLRRAVGAGGKGWPKGFQNEVVIGWPSGGSIAPWDHRLAWSFYGDASQWSSAAFVADLVVAFILIAAPACVFQWWIVRRGNRLRVRIVDLLVVAVMVAAVLAWRQSHLQLQSVEERLVATLPAPGANFRSMWNDPRWRNRGPLWFDRLLGLGNYSCFRHLIQIDVIVEEMTEDDWTLLSQAAYVSDIRLWGQVSAETADAFATLKQLRALELCSGRQLYAPAAELQRLTNLGALESIVFYRRDLLIENMDAIAAIPTLKEIDVSGILATIAEQHAFRDAHPRLAVKCVEPPSSKFEGREIDLWEVAHARLVRWRNEDSVKLNDPSDYDRTLDLRGIQLKPERLLRLQPVLATATHLKFDKNSAVPAVLELLRKCRNVTTINAIGLPADREMLECMAKMPSLMDIDISQGSATVEDFLQLQRLKEFAWLNLYETALPEEELSKLLDELNRYGHAVAYRGLDDTIPAIEAVIDPDGSFGKGF